MLPGIRLYLVAYYIYGTFHNTVFLCRGYMCVNELEKLHG